MVSSYTPYSGMTPDQVRSGRQQGAMLQRAGMDTDGMRHWTQMLGSVLQSGVGSAWQDQANQGEKEGRASANMLLAQALQGGDLKSAIGTGLSNPWAADTFQPLAAGMLKDREHAESPFGKIEMDKARAAIAASQAAAAASQAQTSHLKAIGPYQIDQARLAAERGVVQAQQYPNMTPDQRVKVAPTLGLQPGTPEHTQFIATGQYQPANDPIELMLRERLKQGVGGAPGQPPAAQPPASPPAGAPAAPMPNPNIRPQSAPVEQQADPNFIQAQAQVAPQPMPQVPPQTAPQRDMVDLPGIGKVDVDTAKALAFNYARKGNTAAAKMIEEAIGSGLDKTARTELDKTRINLTNQLGRLNEIERQFNPSYQQAGTQLDMLFKAASEKMGGTLSPKNMQALQKFHTYRSTTFGHFNQMLNELSGTAVSYQEFRRIKAQLPNPGTGFANGILDGHSPSEFQARLGQAKRDVSLALARANFMAAHGFRGDKEAMAAAMPLDAVPRVIEQRGQMLEQQLRQQFPQANPKDIQNRVDQQLRQEFGI